MVFGNQVKSKKTLSAEHKAKISASMKGKNTWMIGRSASAATREKLSKSHKGLNTWMKGKTFPERWLKWNSSKVIDRFWKYTNKLEDDSCWNWLGGLSEDGYGQFGYRRTAVGAHRYSMMLYLNRELVAGECVLHHCDNPRCVNPRHLWLGTPADNSADMVRKERTFRGGGAKGESNNHAKLTVSKVMKIRRLAAKGVLRSEIAAKFGVTEWQIWSIVSRRSWKHVQS